METLRNLNTKDLELLLSLDKKLHYIRPAKFTPNMGGKTLDVTVDCYTDSSMSIKEMGAVLKAISRGNFVLYPINTASGFAVGFCVGHPETKEELLTFKESQLPRGYDFAKLSEYFMKPQNVERAKALGISIVNRRDHYDY